MQNNLSQKIFEGYTKKQIAMCLTEYLIPYIKAKTHLNTPLLLLRQCLLTNRMTRKLIDWFDHVKNNKILASLT